MTAADSKTLRRRTVLAMAGAVIALAGASNAFANSDPVDLKVVDRETGQPLRVWAHHGRLFVAGRPGARYSLRVTNHTDHRVQVVLSVDGVNVVSGETASYDQTGYILWAHQTYDVTGWRKSESEVAAFNFAPLPQSYAARTGRPGDVGVIGMAVFNERVQVQPYATPEASQELEEEPDYRSSHADDEDAAAPRSAPPLAKAEPGRARLGAPPPPPAPQASSPSSVVVTAERRDEKLGTGHGARERSVVTMVDFDRATPYPVITRQIEYDTYRNLVARGVIRPWRDVGRRPRPFPSTPGGAGFVPDPPQR